MISKFNIPRNRPTPSAKRKSSPRTIAWGDSERIADKELITECFTRSASVRKAGGIEQQKLTEFVYGQITSHGGDDRLPRTEFS